MKKESTLSINEIEESLALLFDLKNTITERFLHVEDCINPKILASIDRDIARMQKRYDVYYFGD